MCFITFEGAYPMKLESKTIWTFFRVKLVFECEFEISQFLGPLDLGTLGPCDSWTSSLLQHLLILPLTSIFNVILLRKVSWWVGGWIHCNYSYKLKVQVSYQRFETDLGPGPKLDNIDFISDVDCPGLLCSSNITFLSWRNKSRRTYTMTSTSHATSN